MPQLALYLKWRPRRFDEVVGQLQVTRTLRNSLKAGRVRHAYLFSGPRGTGKTTTARLLAKAINCDGEDAPCGDCRACRAIQEGRYLDLIEIDAATHTGVDDVRELREKIVFLPSEGRFKVYIIDEVHRFTGNAFDALLKTLEEPPAHAVFVLATTEVERVPATIQSRCLHFAFRRVPQKEIAAQLEKIAQAEGFQYEDEALALIAREGNGSVRDGISLLDQLLAEPGETLTLEYVRSVIGTGNLEAVHGILAALRREDVAAGLRGIQDALDSGADPRQLGQQIVEQLRAILLWQTGVSEAAGNGEMAATGEWPRRRLLVALSAFSAAANQMRRGWQPQLDLELAFLRCVDIVGKERKTGESSRDIAAPSQPRTAIRQQHQPASDQVAADRRKPMSADGELTLRTIQSHWPELLEITHRYHSHVAELLRQVVQVELTGNTLRLFTKSLFLEKWGDAEKKAALERGVRELFGDRLLVEFADSNSSAERAKANGGEINPLEDLLPVAKDLGAEILETNSE